jgi:hypothetical protein
VKILSVLQGNKRKATILNEMWLGMAKKQKVQWLNPEVSGIISIDFYSGYITYKQSTQMTVHL